MDLYQYTEDMSDLCHCLFTTNQGLVIRYASISGVLVLMSPSAGSANGISAIFPVLLLPHITDHAGVLLVHSMYFITGFVKSEKALFKSPTFNLLFGLSYLSSS